MTDFFYLAVSYGPMRCWVMPKRISKPTTDELADRAVLSRIMAQMGRKGGKIGGKRRMETMTAEQRSQVALKAAQARWSKRRKSS